MQSFFSLPLPFSAEFLKDITLFPKVNEEYFSKRYFDITVIITGVGLSVLFPTLGIGIAACGVIKLIGRYILVSSKKANAPSDKTKGEPPEVLDVFATLQNEKTWLCLRAVRNAKEMIERLGYINNFDNKAMGKSYQEYDLDKITRPKGFKDRSVTPAGYDSPDEAVGFLIKVREENISEFVDNYDSNKAILEVKKFIGTKIFSGCGKRDYIKLKNRKYIKLDPLYTKDGLFFKTFTAFKKYKDKGHGGYDEFITDITTEKIVGIFVHELENKIDAEKEALHLKSEFAKRTNVSLPIYEYKYAHFELMKHLE